MHMIALPLALLATALLGAFTCDPARAQTRVFVAAQGSDANPCTFAQPCRTFQKGHDTVAANGEIDVLDPAGYGALIINKSISIQGHGFAGLAVPSGDGITISAGATDQINLRGLLLDGVGAGNRGINFNTGGSLNIQDCLVRNFTVGILFAPSASSELSVSNTVSADNIHDGIRANPTGSGTVKGVLDHVEMDHNGENGLTVVGDASTGTVNFTLSNSVAAHNIGHGVVAVSLSAPTTLMVRNSTMSSNVQNGVFQLQNHSLVRITHSTITDNAMGFVGTIESFGDNALRGNGTDGTPTSTIPLK